MYIITYNPNTFCFFLIHRFIHFLIYYDVKVKGDIKKSEKITVTPDATVSMTDANGKAAVDVTITQAVKDFAADDVNATEGSSTTGSIDGSNLTAGSWSGTLNFAIDKVDVTK